MWRVWRPIWSPSPHYHAIIFGLSFKDKNLLQKVWDKGFIYIGLVSGESIGYCTDYVLKKWKKGDKEHENDPRNPPFHLQSQGFGLNYLEEHFDEIEKQGSCKIGKTSGLPRYFKKKILSTRTAGLSDLPLNELTNEQKQLVELEKQRAFARAYDIRLENEQKNFEKFELYKSKGWFNGSFDDWFRLSNRQKYLNAEGRTRMYKHKGEL